MLHILMNLVYAKTKTIYFHYYEQLKNLAPPSVLLYFEKNWHPIRTDWSFYGMKCGNLNNKTNNRLECINGLLKLVIELSSSI